MMRYSVILSITAAMLPGLSLPVFGEAPVARNDAYSVPYRVALTVDAPGVLANDTAGGSAELVSGVGHGVLTCTADPPSAGLCPDGSFSYMPDASFTGFDSFTYRVVVDGASSEATVELSACADSATATVCWQESAFLERLAELGYSVLREGFEDDVVWGPTREPLTESDVVSQGLRWRSNHPDPPAANELTTGDGPARSGLFGVYDADHGHATGTTAECDVDNPPDHCLFRDGLTVTREPGEAKLYAAGGYFRGTQQPKLVAILDSEAPLEFGIVDSGEHQFFGVIDVGGFSSFRVEETDGKIGQARLIFADDFSFASVATDDTPPWVTRVDSRGGHGGRELGEGELTWGTITQLLVTFSEPMRDLGATGPGGVSDPDSYLLVEAGGDGFQTASCDGGAGVNDQVVPVGAVSWEGEALLTATLDLDVGTALEPGFYRLLACSEVVADVSGNPLDGDGDGVGGDDFARTFVVISDSPLVPAVDDPVLKRGATDDSADRSATWHVGPRGRDVDDCRTPSTPCRTVGEASRRALPGDVIRVASGVYPETLYLQTSVTIVGEGRGTVLDGAGAPVVVTVAPGVQATMFGLEVCNGTAGGVLIDGSLTILSSWIHHNGDGASGSFGAVANDGTAVIDSCTLSDNHGDVSAAVSNSGRLEIVGSSVFANRATRGAAIDNRPGATLDLSWVTISGNGAVGVGGGGVVSSQGTILSGHTTANCGVAVVSLGHNLEDGDSCGLSLAMADRINVDPLLETPSSDHGWTPTMRPGDGSPAVDAAGSLACPAADQRGVVRSLDGDEDGVAVCDAGAVEVDPAEHPLVMDGFESGDTSFWSAASGGS